MMQDNDVETLVLPMLSGILMGSKDILHSEQTVIELGKKGGESSKEGEVEHLSCYHQGM